MKPLRLLIADDQPLMRAGFRAVLEATGEMKVVAEAGDELEGQVGVVMVVDAAHDFLSLNRPS